MDFADKELKCIDCGAEFVFTAGEQLLFRDKQFKNDPKHCNQCRAKRMDFVDREVTCIDCGAKFVFTTGEQIFFHKKHFQSTSKHCAQCKVKRNRGFRKPVCSETPIMCAQCGSETTVPFKPTHGKPVLCRACFRKVA